MIRMNRPQSTIRRGVDPGKRCEIMNEMSLIEVADLERYVRPLDSAIPGEALQRSLKPVDATEQLRSKTNFAAKQIDKVTLTKSRLSDYCTHARQVWSFGKLPQCEPDRGARIERRCCRTLEQMGKKRGLKQVESFLCAVGFEQTVA